MERFKIPNNISPPNWVVEHFGYLNSVAPNLSAEQKQCNSELTNISNKYKAFTDKGPNSDYWIKHNYTELYDRLFLYHKNKSINFLEIGIRQGGSLLMWHDYFQFGHIYGVDRNLKQIECDLSHERINCLQFNAYDSNQVENAFKKLKFDIVIDDGSHEVNHQVKMINIWTNYLNDNGLLIIEDVRSIEDAKNIIHKFDGPINQCSIIDRTHCIPSLDDICVVFYK